MTTKISRKIDRQKWVKFFTHLIVILMLFILPDLFFAYSRPHWKITPMLLYSIYIKALVYMSVFYIDYYVVLKRAISFKRRRVLSFVGWNVLIIIVALAIMIYLQYMITGVLPGQHLPKPGAPAPSPDLLEASRRWEWLRFINFLVRDTVMLILVIALVLALRLSESWNKLEQKHEQLVAIQKTDELESLKNQLNPHFLFNTLNTIYALIAISPDQAQDAVHQLSTLLRYVLYENPATVKLSQEINFAKSYISLMEMRIGQHIVKAKYADDAVAAHADVPPMLFISLIENALKHGNTGYKEHPIEIAIDVDETGDIICHTRNHFISKGVDQNDSSESKSNGGVGIANLRRRLQLIYGDRATLSTNIHDDVYEATLRIVKT